MVSHPPLTTNSSLDNRKMRFREYRFVFIYAVVVVVVTQIPYIIGHIKAPPEREFNGDMVCHADMNSYFSYMKQSADGKWLFQNQFTPEKHNDVFFNLEWLITGKISYLFGVSLVTSFEILRVFTGLLLIFAFYLLSTFFLESRVLRRIALIMFSLGGGFQWLYILSSRMQKFIHINIFPVATWDSLHPFFQILLLPHFAIGHAFLLIFFCLFILGEQTGKTRYYALSGVVCAALGIIRPFDMAVAFFSVLIFVFLLYVSKRGEFRLRETFHRLLAIIIPIPVYGYCYYIFYSHSVFKWWNIQNVVQPPLPGVLFLSLGFISFLALYNFRGFSNFREKPAREVFLASCIFSNIALVYSFPILKFTLQLITTLVGPLLILGVIGLERRVIPILNKRKLAYALLTLFLIFNSLSSAWLYEKNINQILSGGHYTDKRLISAFKWLDDSSKSEDIVISSFSIGNMIPRYSGNKVFCGYTFSTVDVNNKIQNLNLFFNPETSDEYRVDFIEKYGIKYLFYGPDERATGYNPQTSSFLEKRYSNDIVTIFGVTPSSYSE